MKRIANTTATVAAEKAAVAQHTTTERKSAERSTSMKRTSTTAKAATATKPMTIDAGEARWTFTATTIGLMGQQFPASKYAIANDGSVYVLATIAGGGVRLHFDQASPVYHEALEVAAKAKAAKAAEPAKPVETKAVEPAKQAKPATKRKAPAKAAKQPEAKPAEPAKPVETKAAEPAKQAKPATKRKAPAKAAKQPAAKAAEPAKPVAVPADGAWIGTTIEGKGWRIAFDEAAQRTRVIVDGEPSAKQRAAIDAAGFYWSATTKSWNKKLTRKAYRAAQALAEALNAIK